MRAEYSKFTNVQLERIATEPHFALLPETHVALESERFLTRGFRRLRPLRRFE